MTLAERVLLLAVAQRVAALDERSKAILRLIDFVRIEEQSATQGAAGGEMAPKSDREHRLVDFWRDDAFQQAALLVEGYPLTFPSEIAGLAEAIRGMRKCR